MLLYFIPKLKENLIFKTISKFFNSYWYMSLIAILTIICAQLGLELITYTIVACLCFIGLLFSEDGTYMIPPLFYMYVTFSRKNNNIQAGGGSIFDNPANKTWFTIIVASVAVLVITRFVFALVTNKNKKPKLWIGFTLLAIAYVLGGLLSDNYGYKTALFGLGEFLSIGLVYFLVFYTVDYDKHKLDYFAWLLTILGIILIWQTIDMYRIADFKLTNLKIHRGHLYTGWGWYNNVGAETALALAGPAYFALKYKKLGFIFLLIETLFLFFILFSQSRGSIVGGIAIYALTIIYVLVKNDDVSRIINLFTIGLILLGIGIMCIIFKEKFDTLFGDIIESILGDNVDNISSGRITIWKNALNQYKEYPIFGKGFLLANEAGAPTFSILPARYHNTYIQLLASTGTVGIVAYAIHRFETIIMFIKKHKTQTTFISFAILSILITSIFDCHFFNIGPGIQYGVLLALAEGIKLKNDEKVTE